MIYGLFKEVKLTFQDLFDDWFGLRHIYKEIVEGYRNLSYFLPLIWDDKDYDWTYILILLVAKLRKQAAFTAEHGCHARSKQDARLMIYVANIFDRVAKDEYHDSGAQVEFDLRRAFGLLEKNIRNWWD